MRARVYRVRRRDALPLGHLLSPPEQKALTAAMLGRLGAARLWSGPIVIEVVPAVERYVAQHHRQEYFARSPSQPYCRAVVAPKIQTFHKRFLEELKRTGLATRGTDRLEVRPISP